MIGYIFISFFVREASLTFLFGMVAEQVDAHILIEVVSYNGSTLHDGEMKRSTSGGFESPYEKKRYDLDVNAGSSPAHSTIKIRFWQIA